MHLNARCHMAALGIQDMFLPKPYGGTRTEWDISVAPMKYLLYFRAMPGGIWGQDCIVPALSDRQLPWRHLVICLPSLPPWNCHTGTLWLQPIRLQRQVMVFKYYKKKTLANVNIWDLICQQCWCKAINQTILHILNSSIKL